MTSKHKEFIKTINEISDKRLKEKIKILKELSSEIKLMKKMTALEVIDLKIKVIEKIINKKGK